MLPEGCALPGLHDGHIGCQERIGHALQHLKTALHAQFVEIIKENSAYAALLLPVFQAEILVAPKLKARVLVFAVRRQSVLADLVKMHSVFFKGVIRREVHATAEPANQLTGGGRGGNHAHVHVNRRHIGVKRMENQGNAHRFKGGTC